MTSSAYKETHLYSWSPRLMRRMHFVDISFSLLYFHGRVIGNHGLCSHVFQSVGAAIIQQANLDKVPHKELTSYSSESYKSKVIQRAHFLVLTLSPAGCVPSGGSGKGALWALILFRRAPSS